MRTYTLLMILICVPLQAEAQGRGRPQPQDNLELTSSFSGREGFDSRSAGFKSGFSLGSLGGYRFSAAAGAEHHRTWTRGRFPGELYDTSLGMRAAGKKWSFGAGMKSNSDRPYNSPSETDLSLDASTLLSRKGPHSLLLGFNYSTRRSFLRGVPIPFLSYSYTSQRLSVFFPFALKWKFSDGGEFSASYFPPQYFSLGLSQKTSDTLTLGISGGMKLSQYLLAGRPDKDDSLFLEQPYAGLNAAVTPAEGYELSLRTAWGFKGRYFTGRQYDVRHGKTTVGAGPLLGIDIKKSF
jgi:hypothetical protein